METFIGCCMMMTVVYIIELVARNTFSNFKDAIQN